MAPPPSPMTVDNELVEQTGLFINQMSTRKVACIVLLVPIEGKFSPLAASNMFDGCQEKADALRAWVEFLEQAQAEGRTEFIKAPRIN